MPTTGSAPGLKSKLWEELALKAELITGGVAITPQALELAAPGVRSQEQVHSLFEMDFDTHDFELPSGYTLPNGLSVPFRWNARSPNVIGADGDRTILVRNGHAHGEVTFHPRPVYYGKRTSDGQAMETVAVLARHRALFVAYSNECSYKEKGEDCLFCNINHTKDVYGERGGIFWKTAQQIGETAAEAFREGIIDYTFKSGEKKQVHFQRLGNQTAFMKCGMYGGTPGGNIYHGMDVGERVEGDRFDVTRPEVRLALSGLNEHHCRITCDGETTTGILQPVEPDAYEACLAGTRGWRFLD